MGEETGRADLAHVGGHIAGRGKLAEAGRHNGFSARVVDATAGTPTLPIGPVMTTAMQELDRWIARAALAVSPVLIHGETGTGKERVAHSLHARSPRAHGPLKVINCAAIPDTLAEGLLFGHERGAFTGALANHPGLFEQAHGGTLFLDEVGELPARIQAMLLRALETKRVNRIGSFRELAVDVRIVTATNRDLEAMMQAGGFRKDLLYRLNAFTLRVPPLRERRDDIVPLAQEFLTELGQDWEAAPTGFSTAALGALAAHDWPGNVRQLRNVVERAMLSSKGRIVDIGDLPLELRDAARATPLTADPAAVPKTQTHTETPRPTFREQVQAFESALIREALMRCRGNQRAAARHLGIPLRTLVNKIKTYSLRNCALARED